MGTPDFAVPILQMLIHEHYEIQAVVTQPDRPQGRKRIITPSAVKLAAIKHGITVLQPERLRSPEAVAVISALQPDLIVTAAYGQLLPKGILDLPKYGCLNVHASLLPKYRGGAPIQRAIMNGDDLTGVTIMYMAAGLDTGDIITQEKIEIAETDNAGTMFAKLSLVGAELLRTTLPPLLAGKLQARPQDEQYASIAPNLTRLDEKLNWNHSATQLFNQIRALCPWPGAFTLWDQAILKVWACRKTVKTDRVLNNNESVPGTVLQINNEGIAVQTGDGVIWLTSVQPAGKKPQAAAQFQLGTTMKVGIVLGVSP